MKKIAGKDRALADTKQLLNALQVPGKASLSRGFQFLFYLMRDSENTPEANIALFLQKEETYQPITQSRSGKLLKTLIKSPGYRVVIKEESQPDADTKDNSHGLTPPVLRRKLALRHTQTLTNPFLTEEHRICIPNSLAEEAPNCSSISTYLDDNSAGIHPYFRKNPAALESFAEMHALLYEMAKILLACDEAALLIETEGDILLHSKSNQQITLLMESFKKLCDALTKCQKKLTATTAALKKELDLKGDQQTPQDKAWIKNYLQLATTHSQFWQAIAACLTQINLLKEKAESITPRQWVTEAKPDSEKFAASTEKLNQHLAKIPSLAETVTTPAANGASFFTASPPSSPRSSVRNPNSPRQSTSTLGQPTSPRSRAGTLGRSTPPPKPSSNTIPAHRRKFKKTEDSTQTPHSTDGTTPQAVTPVVARRKSAELIELWGIREPKGTQNTRLINDTNLSILNEALSGKPDATEIHLQKNDITGKGGTSIFKSLKTRHRLATLRMSQNPKLFDIHQDGYLSVVALSDLLKGHPSLRYLILDGCGLNDACGRLLCDGLANNTSLELLDLGSNAIEDQATIAICSALTNHPTLCHLHIDSNKITEVGGQALLKLAKENPRITTLELWGNDAISNALRGDIERQIALNKGAAVTSTML